MTDPKKPSDSADNEEPGGLEALRKSVQAQFEKLSKTIVANGGDANALQAALEGSAMLGGSPQLREGYDEERRRVLDGLASNDDAGGRPDGFVQSVDPEEPPEGGEDVN